jgi:hypothetical protein
MRCSWPARRVATAGQAHTQDPGRGGREATPPAHWAQPARPRPHPTAAEHQSRSAAMASDGASRRPAGHPPARNGGPPALTVAISGLAVPTSRPPRALLLEAIDPGARWRRRNLSLSAGCAAVGSPGEPGRHESASSRSVPARCPRQGPEPGCGAGPRQDHRP